MKTKQKDTSCHNTCNPLFFHTSVVTIKSSGSIVGVGIVGRSMSNVPISKGTDVVDVVVVLFDASDVDDVAFVASDGEDVTFDASYVDDVKFDASDGEDVTFDASDVDEIGLEAADDASASFDAVPLAYCV